MQDKHVKLTWRGVQYGLRQLFSGEGWKRPISEESCQCQKCHRALETRSSPFSPPTQVPRGAYQFLILQIRQ